MANARTTTPETREVKVERVIDGKTFETEGGETVRLANVYVPRMGVPGCYAARTRLRNRIHGKTVCIEPQWVDKYGRTIAILANLDRMV